MKTKRTDDTRLRTKSGKYVAECKFCFCPEGCGCSPTEPCACGAPKRACIACADERSWQGTQDETGEYNCPVDADTGERARAALDAVTDERNRAGERHQRDDARLAAQARVKADADHFCNEPLRCPRCIWRFWKWAENYSRRFERPKGKRARDKAKGPSAPEGGRG